MGLAATRGSANAHLRDSGGARRIQAAGQGSHLCHAYLLLPRFTHVTHARTHARARARTRGLAECLCARGRRKNLEIATNLRKAGCGQAALLVDNLVEHAMSFAKNKAQM